MECAQYREAASARLDGEAIGMSAAALDAHLGACADCAAWLERATSLTRSLRMRAAAVPDLTDSILASTQMPRPRRARPGALALMRVALGAAGAVQLVTSVPALTGDAMGLSMAAHAAHESAAWNLAVAVGFLAVAASPRRVAGVLPVLATFVLILSLLSIPDWLGGHVGADRLATHLGVLVGVGALVAVHRLQLPRRSLPPGAMAESAGQDGSGASDGPPRGGLRGVA